MPQRSKAAVWGSWTTVLACLAGVAAVAVPRLPAADTWWHLAAGRVLVELGRLPVEDPFSFGPGRGPWLNHEWLAEVVFYGLYRLGGLEGLFLSRTFLVVVAFGVLPVLGATRRGVPAATAGFVALACCLAGEGWAFFDARAYLFTYLGLSVTILACREFLRTDSRSWLYPLPLVTVLWANCHGGFILGPLTVATAAAGCLLPSSCPRRARDLGVTAAMSLALSAIGTPFGVEALAFPFSLVGRSAFSLGLNEWARPDLIEPLSRWPFAAPGQQWPYLVLVTGSAALLVLRRAQVSWPERFWSLGFLGAGLLAWRHEPLAALVMAHVLPDLVPRCPRNRPFLGAVVGTLALALSVGALAGRLRGGAESWALEREMFPVDAVTFMEANPSLPRELFNPYEWGGYLEWRLAPQFKTFIDGRANTVFSEERYARALWVQYGREWVERLEQAGLGALLEPDDGWTSVLDEAGIRMVLCSHVPGVGDLNERLERSGRWFRIYDDRVASLYLRDEPEMRRLAAGLRHPVTAWSLLVQALDALARGDEPAATDLLGRSVALDPRLPHARVYLGVLLLRAGRDREGAQELEKALELDPTVREAHFNLGLRALKAGDRAGAIRHLELELELDPAHPQAGNVLRELRSGGGG